MDRLALPATQLTPAIDFDYRQHRLSIRGESYPENVTIFYGPVLAALRDYLDRAAAERARVSVELELIYINSSSTRSFQQMLALLDAAGAKGASICVAWIVDPEDDAMAELGQDLLSDKQWLATEVRQRA